MLRLVVAVAVLAMGVLLETTSGSYAQGLVPCARENGFCRVPYPTRVIYGVPGRSAARDVDGRGIPCSNSVFGDPAPGAPKRCSYVAREYGGGYGRPRGGYERADYEGGMGAWRICAREGGFCGFRGRMRVRYGAGRHFTEGVFRNGVACNNGTFGDPAPGVPKICQIVR